MLEYSGNRRIRLRRENFVLTRKVHRWTGMGSGTISREEHSMIRYLNASGGKLPPETTRETPIMIG